ncbi:ribosomal protein L20 [Candidatus Carsonella ruddii CS isolate Thao2000]|uniref:Large ribosomal subunit protein bL20 n=1 Tax=Candidatus Carsonella ruddii CS isolate Thao2000 TaxID=1202537 RepID=J7H0D5_CARRU|nr:50S ribosomal protein L20 [Candidatus Carsonella ruddii]AFP83765.1 ribosomal protein L20 [Candidatus Carsonella ruddii CS isolate Thao2000]
MTRSTKNIKTKKKFYFKFSKKFIGRKNCYKLSKQYSIKSLNYKFIDKKKKINILKKKKNSLINFLLRIYYGINYSNFVFILKNNNCKINKLKILIILLKLIF